MKNFKQSTRRRRPAGMAALELVIATAIGFPILALIMFAGVFACRVLYSVIGATVGSPLL